jgi:hypothetical protein
MAAIVAGRMVNADSAITGESPPPPAARVWPPNSRLLAPGTEHPMKGKGPSVSLVSEVSGFFISRVEPLSYYFFHSKLISFLKVRLDTYARGYVCARVSLEKENH